MIGTRAERIAPRRLGHSINKEFHSPRCRRLTREAHDNAVDTSDRIAAARGEERCAKGSRGKATTPPDKPAPSNDRPQ